MKRILFSTYYGANDIASFNCAHGPFSQMKGEVEIVVPTPLEFDGKTAIESQWWRNYRWWLNVDLCFVHRPSGWYGQQILKAAMDHRVPIWVHHDDDLLAIPETNPYHQGITLQDRQYPSVEDSYREADVLSCQSVLMANMLREKYGRDDVFLIPIALDDRLLHLKRPFTNNERVCWRGSDSHKHDLISHKLELQEVFDKFSDKEFHFFILNPRELGFKVKHLVIHEPLDMFAFYNRITEINASRHIVLLEDNHFNRVKSHLAWLDATLAGSSVYAPMFEEFDRTGVSSYKPGDFYAHFGWFLSQNGEERNANSWITIKQSYINSVTNKVRSEIIRNF